MLGGVFDFSNCDEAAIRERRRRKKEEEEELKRRQHKQEQLQAVTVSFSPTQRENIETREKKK